MTESLRLFAEVLCVFRRWLRRLSGSFLLGGASLAYLVGESHLPQDLRDPDADAFALLGVRDEKHETALLGDAVSLLTDSLYRHIQFVAHIDWRDAVSRREIAAAPRPEASTVISHIQSHLSIFAIYVDATYGQKE